MCVHRGWKLQRLRMILFPIILREAFCFFVPGSVGYRIRLFFFYPLWRLGLAQRTLRDRRSGCRLAFAD